MQTESNIYYQSICGGGFEGEGKAASGQQLHYVFWITELGFNGILS